MNEFSNMKNIVEQMRKLTKPLQEYVRKEDKMNENGFMSELTLIHKAFEELKHKQEVENLKFELKLTDLMVKMENIVNTMLEESFCK